MPVLHTKNVTLAYNNKIVAKELNLEILQGKITVLIGPNASGKSTILKALSRTLKPKEGTVYLNNQDINKKASKEIAKQIAFLSQSPSAPESLTVTELVSYGRFPYQKWGMGLENQDYQAIETALKKTGLNNLAHKTLNSLSGGQKQVAWLAMILAQDTNILLLDEPTTFLDVAHQLSLLKLLTKLNSESGCTIVMVLHDINQAARYAQHIIVISEGTIFARGTPHEVITTPLLKQVFAVNADVIDNPHTQTPMYIPY